MSRALPRGVAASTRSEGQRRLHAFARVERVRCACVIVACVLAAVAALVAGCSEQQAASSADRLVNGAGAQTPPSGSLAAPAAATRPLATTQPAKQSGKPSLFEHGVTTGRKIVAIAFQLGASPGQPGGVNRDVLDTLNTDGVHATFFMAALWAQAHPDAAKQIAGVPAFEVGNGGYSSEYLSRMSAAVIEERTRKAQQVIQATTGEKPQVYRTAQTGYTPASITAIAAAGVRPVSGDIDLTAPKAKLSASGIANDALSRVRTGSIIVIRGDTSDPRLVKALVFLLGGLKRAGYEDATVSQLIGLQ